MGIVTAIGFALSHAKQLQIYFFSVKSQANVDFQKISKGE